MQWFLSLILYLTSLALCPYVLSYCIEISGGDVLNGQFFRNMELEDSVHVHAAGFWENMGVHSIFLALSLLFNSTVQVFKLNIFPRHAGYLLN